MYFLSPASSQLRDLYVRMSVPDSIGNPLNANPLNDDTAELRLKRLLQRYEALSSAPGVIVWVIDAALRPVATNDAW